MKLFKSIVLFILCTEVTFAQQFNQKIDIALPDSIVSVSPEWVDLDNDGLLDILLISKTITQKNYFLFIKGDTVNIPVVLSKAPPIFTSLNYCLYDLNSDNQIDIIVSGTENNSTKTMVYYNEGNFEFTLLEVDVPAFTKSLFADLDNDARPEWIMGGEASGSYFIKILKKENDVWKVVQDLINLNVSSLEVLDVDGNGLNDLFVSGKFSLDSLFTGVYKNEGDLSFTTLLKKPWAGVSSIADYNHDGIFDVLFTGIDKNNVTVSKTFLSENETYTLKDNDISLKAAKTFSADLNSDGEPDVNFSGKSTSSDTVNVISFGLQEFDTLNHRNITAQSFGDQEHDGDLDLVQIEKRTSLHVLIHKNSTPIKNQAPSKSSNAVAIPVFDRLFMYWDKPVDDHTASTSISFDVHIESPLFIQPGNFDLNNEKRITSSYGNNGMQNFKLLKTSEPISFFVQAVDNSLHAGEEEGSICAGGSMTCATIAVEKLSACSHEMITLTAPSNALWFSFADGFLGSVDTMNITVNKKDTLFYFLPNEVTKSCAALNAFTLDINNDTVKVEHLDKYACAPSTLEFKVEPGLKVIEWSSNLKGNLGSDPILKYSFTQPDSLSVELSNPEGCRIIRTTAINVSRPVVVVNTDKVKIMKGQSVDLLASGAQRYSWTPVEGLSDAGIPNPVASPLQSVVYTVTGYDSIGCAADATVSVVVESAGFVPTLFTPNGDGKNDLFKAYGLSSVNGFLFEIFNREGSLIYKTDNVMEAMSGWDGTSRGAKQPTGVYFWRVKGYITSGKLLLNGKESGSVMLVR